jgi:hypothetical protein
MKHVVLATLGPFLILPIATHAQVKVTVPVRQYKVQEKIYAKVENGGKDAVTLCVEAGQTSPLAGGVEATPTPFWMQVHSNGKWSTLLIGPDVDSIETPLVLEAGEAQEFPFRSNDYKEMRLRLNYWRGSIPDLDCKAPPKGPELVTSNVFTVLPISSGAAESSYYDPNLITPAEVASFPKVDKLIRYKRVAMGMGRIEDRTSALGGYEGPNGEQISTVVADFGIIAAAKAAHQHVDQSAAEIIEQEDILDESGNVIGYTSVLTLTDKDGKKSTAVVMTTGGNFTEYISSSLRDILAFEEYEKLQAAEHAKQ